MPLRNVGNHLKIGVTIHKITIAEGFIFSKMTVAQLLEKFPALVNKVSLTNVHTSFKKCSP